MTFRTFGRTAAALAACALLTGCPKDFHLVLFNNTDDAVVFRRRAQDPSPAVIVAGTGYEVTGVSTDDVSIERGARSLRYRFPLAYINPEAAPMRAYRREVKGVGKAYCLQLAEDNRLYLLRRGESYRDRAHAEQPAGFPLVPQ